MHEKKETSMDGTNISEHHSQKCYQILGLKCNDYNEDRQLTTVLDKKVIIYKERRQEKTTLNERVSIKTFHRSVTGWAGDRPGGSSHTLRSACLLGPSVHGIPFGAALPAG